MIFCHLEMIRAHVQQNLAVTFWQALLTADAFREAEWGWRAREAYNSGKNGFICRSTLHPHSLE